MATKITRATAVLNALSDGAITAQTMLRIANAYVAWLGTQGVDPATLTNEQKAGMFLLGLRQQVQNILADIEADSAAQTASKAAKAAVATEVDLGNDGGIVPAAAQEATVKKSRAKTK